jgi:predicted MFS family arabinose efflux permease
LRIASCDPTRLPCGRPEPYLPTGGEDLHVAPLPSLGSPEIIMNLRVAAKGGAPAWGAVFALTLCVGALIASEFMPVSLLTPIAASLHTTEGGAGLAIAISGTFAVLTSLTISPTTGGIDRRRVLLALTTLMLISGLIVTVAPNAIIFMTGRALIGIVIGGFWSMSAATVMRLVPQDEVATALGVLNAGNALATTVAAPLGSFLGQYIGWRGAFFCVVPVALLSLVWQSVSLPPMPAERGARSNSVFRVLGRPQVPLGMVAVAAFFMGQFALFTYLRPFLEAVTQLDVSALSAVLLLMGSAGLLGTFLIGFVLRTQLYSLLLAMPLAMAVIAVALTLFGRSASTIALLLAGWGLIGTAAPVAWWTWLSKVLPDDAEAGGGLMVAVVQLAITAGASLGGVLFDACGYQATFGASAAILCSSAVLALLAWRSASSGQAANRSTSSDILCPERTDAGRQHF